jgi:thioredoxin 1
MFAPIVEKVSDEVKKYKFYKVNIDEISEAASKYSINSIPTLCIFNNGKLIEKTSGFRSEQQLKDILK